MMLFRPTFCCGCGEKIDRVEWRLWTSRKFCEVCESVHRGSELVPRIGIAAVLLVGLFGIGSFFRGVPEPVADSQPAGFTSIRPGVERKNIASVEGIRNPKAEVSIDHKHNEAAIQETAAQPVIEKPDSRTERTFFCGARTKKGTPCSRRVKEEGRCWQHVGQPAMKKSD